MCEGSIYDIQIEENYLYGLKKTRSPLYRITILVTSLNKSVRFRICPTNMTHKLKKVLILLCSNIYRS